MCAGDALEQRLKLKPSGQRLAHKGIGALGRLVRNFVRLTGGCGRLRHGAEFLTRSFRRAMAGDRLIP